MSLFTPERQRPPTVQIMRMLGLEPDPWQVEVLEAGHPRLLLNCCRQAGKTTAVAILGLVEAMYNPMTRVILVSRSHRQSKEMFKQIVMYHKLMRERLMERCTSEELELSNLSRIVCLPCKEETIRGYAHVDLLVIDEAARVPDDLYRAVRPMLAVSNGRMICLSTPYGKRGFFWEAWAKGGEDWKRIEISADKCPRITQKFLDEERRALGESWYRQEYFCSFEAVEGLVYPDAHRCVVKVEELPGHLKPALTLHEPQKPSGRHGQMEWPYGSGDKLVGGIDFGFRNPFAAVWGVLDRDGVLWLTGEHYAKQKPLAHHAQFLPKRVMWYADPASPGEISGLRCAGFAVRNGRNAVRAGIAAVSARLMDGTLKIVEGRCPNLVAEMQLYRYGDDSRGSEEPVAANNHALDALRYLISRIDARRMALLSRRHTPCAEDCDDEKTPAQREQEAKENWRAREKRLLDDAA